MSARNLILDPVQFAAILNVRVDWLYKRTKKTAKDRLPKCPGYGKLRFNPYDPKLQEWVTRNFGPLDLVSIAATMTAGNVDTGTPNE
jgi:hypothetical protein